MRPVLLRIRGFTAYRDEATVEFEGRRLFVITGPTGAGKSSLLDAMTWALYGQVPRVGRSVKELLSQGERDMSVLFEFTVRGQGYRVSRRYPGNTSTRLERLVSDQWVPMADRASDVTHEVERILGMDYATFTRAIVLPQGEFDSFLRGDAKDRRAILSQLIGLGVYQRAGELARARASEHKTQADTIRTQLEKMTLATPEVIAGLRERQEQLTKESAMLTQRRMALGRLGDLARAHHDAQQRAAASAKASQEAEAEVTEADRALAKATRSVEERAAAVERATAELAAIQYDATEHDRLKAAVALLDQRAAAEAALAQARADLEGARRGSAEAERVQREAEAGAKEAAKALVAAKKAEDAAGAALAKAAGRAHHLLEQVTNAAAQAEREATAAASAASACEERVRALRSLQQALASTEADLRRAQEAVTRAEADRASAAEASDASRVRREEAEQQVQTARAALDAARAEDAAAHLRAGLKVGDPCPVCGEPIEKLGKHTAPNLAKVEAALAKAERALGEARGTAETAAATLAAAGARVEECRRALRATEGQRASVEAQLAEHGVSADSLVRVLDEGAEEAARLSATCEAKRREASEHTQTAQALREALAPVPSSVEPAEAKRVPSDPAAVRGELRDALEACAEAAEATRSAERETTVADASARAATQALATAARDVERAERTVGEAEQRLAALGGVEGDPKQVRAALVAAEQQAGRQRELSASLATEREALASIEAARTATAAARDKAAAMLTRRQEEQANVDAAAAEARASLVASWRETLGEGEPSLGGLKVAQEAFLQEWDRVQGDLTTTRMSVEQATVQLEQAERMRADADEHQGQANLIGAVGQDLQGNRFIAYLLHESMQLLAADASERLGNFTNGRYALVAEGDNFLVVDHLNGDEQRSVKTLSGGETFLASLALALALSEHLPEISGTGGAVSLDSLFLDEGFGALDSEALDLAVQGLETLAEGSRMIGVISHVEELSERLPDRIRVEKGANGSLVVA